MTNESKFRHETVTHCNSGAAEFLALAEELGIDLFVELLRRQPYGRVRRRPRGR